MSIMCSQLTMVVISTLFLTSDTILLMIAIFKLYFQYFTSLSGKKVIDVAAGSTHCLALTEDSEVHSWGSNDQCQHFDTLRITKPEPAALPGLDTKHIVGIACGPAQVSFIFELLITICLFLSLRLVLYTNPSSLFLCLHDFSYCYFLF